MSAVGEQRPGSSRFRIVGRLGHGASGEVFEAVDHASHARIAVKMLRDPSPDQIRLLKHEFRAVQDIRHRNLVSLGDLLEEGGQWFFTMELVDGIDLLQWIARPHATRPPFDERRLREGFAQLVAALRALHAAGKVHRDVKPSNVMVTREGRVVLLDFGVVADRRGNLSVRDEEDAFVGTPTYMAPEQALSEEIGPATDWYAVGVVLYQALTGRPPFTGALGELLMRKVAEVPPSPRALVPAVPADLDALCMRLLAIEPRNRPDGAEIAAKFGLVESDDAPIDRGDVFVGRKQELDSLHDAFGSVRDGRSVVVFVEGESGVGKSALVQQFTDRLAERTPGLLLLRGRCYERESVPYKAVDDAIDSLSRALKRAPELSSSLPAADLEVLGRSFPVLKSIVKTTPDASFVDVANPRQKRTRLYDSMRSVMVAVAARAPVVLVLDDLHWADTDSVALLTELLRAPDEPQLMVLCTLRNEPIHAARATEITSEITRMARDVRNVRVSKFGVHDAEALARALIATRDDAVPLSDRALRHIIEETKGHPLFIDELVRRRRGTDEEEHGVHLDDVLWRRIAALDEAARNLLEVVAVAGMPVPKELVARAGHVGKGMLSSVIATLQHARFVHTTGDADDGFVSPYHDRVRESVVAHLEPNALAAAHRHLAVAAEDGESPDPEFLYAHWEGAGESERAAGYAQVAGDRAVAKLAFDHAAHLYARGLALGIRETTARRALMAKLAQALTAAGRETEAADVRLALAEDATELEALELRRQAAEQLLLSGNYDRGRALVRDVLHEVRERFPESPFAVLFWLIVVRLTLVVRGVRVRERDPSKLSTRAVVRIDALWSAGAGFSMNDNARGAYFQSKNLLRALKVGDVKRTARALGMAVCFQSVSGTSGEKRTRAYLAEARRLAEHVGTPDLLALADSGEGYMHFFLANWRKSIDCLSRAEETFRDRCLGVHHQLGAARTMLFRALGYAGRIEELRQRYAPVLRDAEQRRDPFTVLSLQCSAAFLVALADDRVADAEHLLESAQKALPAGAFVLQHYYHLVSMVQLDLYRGRAREARERLIAARRVLRRSLLLRVTSLATLTQDLSVRNALACAERDEATRARYVTEAKVAVRSLAKQPVLWAPPVAMLHSAAIAALEGKRELVVATLRKAVEMLDGNELGLYAVAARCRLAVLVVGAEKERLETEIAAFAAAQKLARVEAIADLYAPGFSGR